jgi:hypothetical protein
MNTVGLVQNSVPNSRTNFGTGPWLCLLHMAELSGCQNSVILPPHERQIHQKAEGRITQINEYKKFDPPITEPSLNGIHFCQLKSQSILYDRISSQMIKVFIEMIQRLPILLIEFF